MAEEEMFYPVSWSSVHQNNPSPQSGVRIYRANYPETINLPESLADLVNLVIHPCLVLLSLRGAPEVQDHPAPLASLILY